MVAKKNIIVGENGKQYVKSKSGKLVSLKKHEAGLKAKKTLDAYWDKECVNRVKKLGYTVTGGPKRGAKNEKGGGSKKSKKQQGGGGLMGALSRSLGLTTAKK